MLVVGAVEGHLLLCSMRRSSVLSMSSTTSDVDGATLRW
jgi:hypothetical protein